MRWHSSHDATDGIADCVSAVHDDDVDDDENTACLLLMTMK